MKRSDNNIVFVFSGIGTQWPGMGAGLFEDEPAFLAGVRAFDRAYSALSGISVLELLQSGKAPAEAAMAHPCVIAIETGLFNLLQAKKITPGAIIGHSGGEVAAAYAAGALTIKEAATITFYHSRILKNVADSGVMAHISLSPDKTTPFLKDFPDITIAAINSPQSVVIAGNQDSVEKIMGNISTATGVFCRQLRINCPLHTSVVEPFLESLADGLAKVRPTTPPTPVFSSLHGGPARNNDFDAAYWCRHIRQPVDFAGAMSAAIKAGGRRFLEIAPHAVLQEAMAECARHSGKTITTAALMRRDEPAAAVLAEALSTVASGETVTPAISHDFKATTEAQRIQNAPAAKRQEMLSKLITECLKEISGGSIQPDARQEFVVMGVSSLLTVKLRNALCERLGISLPVAMLYSYPTIALLSAYIDEQLDHRQSETTTPDGRNAVADSHEPLAITGFACRLPGGAHNPAALWSLLKDGVDAVITVPPERWDAERYYDPDPETPGMSRTKEGGFLTCQLDTFDAPFFGIAAREARQLDPQQRLMLEVIWEAFEQADTDITKMQGSRTGVFIGMSSSDYSHAHRDSYRRELIDAYSLTGSTFSAAAGRLAYLFDFRGPCFTVDTACSSSLVALHCACRSLRCGESDAAIVGGVNLMLIPDLHIAFTKLGAVSPDGRSKAFDDGADGYGRGEGCVMLILKRLSDAERDGDRILALLRGTAINQDGKSNGLTAPNGLAQQRVIAEALADAQLAPADVSYVEAHGTGTALGDSIELQSLAEAYSPGRSPDHPLMIGSVKANLGHLEPAAAVTGAAKIILAMQHRAIPANIHIKTPNCRFDWQSYPLQAPLKYTEWTPANGVRRAGLSAFGFSGTNGHAIFEEYIPSPAATGKAATPAAFMLPLSAKSPESLAALKERYASAVAELSGNALASFCFTAQTGRTHHRWRNAVSGSDGASLAAMLKNAPLPTDPCETPRIAMVFTGQGSQYPDIAKELYQRYDVFKTAIEECAAILDHHGIDLLKLLYGGSKPVDLAQTANAQPVIASIEYALWKLWQAWGVQPAVVAGHSIGEYPAAVAAGILSLPAMLTLVAARAKAMGEAPPNGSMAAVFAAEKTVTERLAGQTDVVIAAVNAPEAVTVSGTTEGVQTFCAELQKDGIGSKALKVSHAFHSPLMRTAAVKFKHALQNVAFNQPDGTVFVSTVTGKQESALLTDPEYWVNQILRPVKFSDAVSTIYKTCTVTLEAGGTAALSGLIAQAANDKFTAVSSLSPKAAAETTMLEAAARLYATGVDLDGVQLYQPYPCEKIDLPFYPFDRKQHWMPVHNEPPDNSTTGSHPVLGRRLNSPALNGAAVFETVFDDKQPLFLHEHIIYGQPISPGAGHLAMLFAAARELWGSPAVELQNIDFSAPLVLSNGTRRIVQIVIDAPRQTESPFRLVSRADGAQEWTTHCTGRILRRPGGKPEPEALQTAPDKSMQTLSKEDFYNTFINAGYEIGRGFQRIESISATDGEAFCRVNIRRNQACEKGHVIYPGAIDSIFQSGLPCLMNTYMNELLQDGTTIVPMHIAKAVLWREMPDVVVCRTWSERVADTAVSFRIIAMTLQGEPVMEIEGLIMRKTDRATLYRLLQTDPAELLYAPAWIAAEPPIVNATDELLIISAGDGKLAAELHRRRGGILLDKSNTQISAETLSNASTRGIKTAVFAYDPGSTQINSDPSDAAVAAGFALVEAAGTIIKNESDLTLWVVTSGATGPDSFMNAFSGSALWGAAMSLAAEDPQRTAGIIDIDLHEASLTAAADMIAPSAGRPFGALRNGQYFTLQLTHTPVRYQSPAIRADATYLITGGSGALGLMTARRLAENGAGCIVLSSRNGAGQEKIAQITAGLETVCRVEDFRCDIADPQQVTSLLERITLNLPPLAGVFHAAGILDDATVQEMSHEKFERVILPKVRGAWLLHQATMHQPLEWFVLFSSAAAILGSGGQANYAAANMMLNELAVLRRKAGLPALSVCWGPWMGGGMAADEKRGARLAANGILSLDPNKALNALEQAAGTDLPVIGIMDMEWNTFINTRSALHGDYLAAFVAKQDNDGNKNEAQVSGTLKTVLESGAPEQRENLEEALAAIAAQTLGYDDIGRIGLRQPLMEQGFDSLMAVEIRNRLMKESGMKLPASFLFSNPTIEKIAAWFIANSAQPDNSSEQQVSSLLDEIDSLID